MIADTAVHLWVTIVAFGSLGFCAVVVILAVLAWVVGVVERYHVRRHARRRGGSLLGESPAGFPRGEP